jgi:NADP-dependent 3-hydroxy acid dehydrogenase YdfG
MEGVHVGRVGTFLVSRTVIPHMFAQNHGRKGNVASAAGK